METARLPIYERFAIALLASLIHALGWTLREREIGRVEWSLRSSRENAMWSLWHETLALGVWFYRRRRIHVMISTSRDGERIAQVTQRLGYAPVRGSTSKGSLGATRRLVAALRSGERAAIGIGVQRGWRLNSWDRFVNPKPFSRVCYAYGDPVWVPRDGGQDVDYLALIQREMERVTGVAEAAASGRQAR